MNPSPSTLSGLQALGRRLLPRFLLNRLDPVEAMIQSGVASFARSFSGASRVLDAGAGECRFRPQFAHTRYFAIDHGKGDPNWDYSHLDVVGALEALPFSSAVFDGLLNIVVLEHVEKPESVLQEMARVLKPRGRIFLVAPLCWELHQIPEDYFRFTEYGLRSLLARAGLRVESLRPIGGYFWLMGRRAFNFLRFWQRGWRVILLPLFVPFFGFVLPLLNYYLDRLDREKIFTLGYVVLAEKAEE